MGASCGEMLKPTVLRSNRPWIRRLKRTAIKADKDRFAELKEKNGGNVNPLAPHEDGRKRFGGNCVNLKQSQVYPQGYAEELHNVWKEEKEQVVDLADSSSDSDYPDVPLEQDSM